MAGCRFLKMFLSLCQGLICRHTLVSSQDFTTLYSSFVEKTVKEASVSWITGSVSSFKYEKSSRPIMAWKLVLSGRFRLLNQWHSFVEVSLLMKTQYFSVDLIVCLDRTRSKNNSLYLGKVVAVFFVCGITSIMVVIYTTVSKFIIKPICSPLTYQLCMCRHNT